MPALPLTVSLLYGAVQPRDTTDSDSPPPFPPFRQPDDDDDVDMGPFRPDPDDLDEALSPGTIAAIVVSVVVFLIVVMVLLAFLNHRRRRAREGEIALKEESTSASVVAASGALDPPPPYDEVHCTSHQHDQERRRWENGSDATGEEEGSDSMRSHATITDGMEPGRHSGSQAR
jgi:hypothetical protein